MRPAQEFGEDHSSLRIAVIVRLQAGKDEIELLVLDGGGDGLGRVEGVEADELVVFEVDGAIRALGQRLAQHLLGARRAARDHDYFSLMLFPLAQGFFERVGIGLIDFIGNIFADPGTGFVQLERRIFLRDLLHTDQNFQEEDSLSSGPGCHCKTCQYK